MTLFDDTVKHLVGVERYKARLARDVRRRIMALAADIGAQVAQADLERMTRRDLDKLLARLNRLIKAAYIPTRAEIEQALGDFGLYEAEWQAEALARVDIALGVPSRADILAAMRARPFQGRFLKGWLDGLEQGTAQRVRQAIRQGYVDGVNPIEIARQIRGTRTRSGIMDISARGAEAMVRTAISHTSSVARSETYKRSDSVRGEQWASVLDHRTSPICRARDGTIYAKGEGPRPPAHIACRSTMIPVTRNNRAALNTRPTYQDWLSRQPKAVQDDILGPTRGELFRKGDYTVDRFVDKSGQEYTLDELRAKDRAAFDEAIGE